MSEQLAADPASLVFLPLAEQLLGRGELAHASRVARKGAERHAHRADVHDLVARIALAQGEEAAAERSWNSSLAIAPDFGAAHRGLGFLCYRQGRWEDAETHLAKARVATPGDPALEAAWEALHVARADDSRSAAAAPALSPAESAGMLFAAQLGDTGQVALLLDSDGLVVAGQYMTAEGEDLGAVIGAHLSGVSDEAARAMRHFGLGGWTRIAIETEAATVVMAPSGEGVTLVAAPRDVPLGLARRTLDQCVHAATAWLGGGA
jgi:predicted regulator of Ras-like GTPase activity (Roadblock/LC7/MglB family)